MKTRVLLVRHGGTLLSAADRFAGSTNVDLSDEGRAQAAALGKRLAGLQIDAAYCSPMQRAIDTAGLVLGSRNMTPVQRDGLREVDHGAWEGQVHGEIEKSHAAEYAAWTTDPFTVAPPGGETGLAVLARALPALRTIVQAHPDQTVLIVSHKATNRILLASLLGMDMRTYRERIAQDLAAFNVLEFHKPSEALVTLMNDVSHYQSWLQ